VVCEPFLT